MPTCVCACPLHQVSILSSAEAVRSCSLDPCYKSYLSPATSETKRKMSTFVNNLKASDSPTLHALGFQKAFQLLRNTSNITRQLTSKNRAHWEMRSLALAADAAGLFYRRWQFVILQHLWQCICKKKNC